MPFVFGNMTAITQTSGYQGNVCVLKHQCLIIQEILNKVQFYYSDLKMCQLQESTIKNKNFYLKSSI